MANRDLPWSRILIPTKSLTNELQPYKSRLPPAAIVGAQNMCLENAEALIEDAKLLNENGRFARAVALCVLSFEELGKIVLLSGALLYKTDKEWGRFWKSFRHHESKRKIVASIEADMFGLTEYKRREEQDMERLVEKMKLQCLYVDSIDGKIYTPLRSFGREIETIASNAIKFAEGRAAMFRRFLEVPPEMRIELADGLQEILAQEHTDSASLQKALVDLIEGLVRK